MLKSYQISIKELQEKAENSSLEKGMIVKALPMHGSWGGLNEVEFYVLSDKAEPMWGHPMAIRHIFDVDPETAQMFARACDKNGKLLFHYIHLPEDCVQVLDQFDWSKKNNDIFLAEEDWRQRWEEMNKEDAKHYEKWKARWKETGKEEHKRWMDLFSRCLNENNTWDVARNNQNPVFTPEMLNEWVQDTEQ